MKDIKMIISEEILKENQKRHLLKDVARLKKLKKEKFYNFLGFLVFYLTLIIGFLVIHYFG